VENFHESKVTVGSARRAPLLLDPVGTLCPFLLLSENTSAQSVVGLNVSVTYIFCDTFVNISSGGGPHRGGHAHMVCYIADRFSGTKKKREDAVEPLCLHKCLGGKFALDLYLPSSRAPAPPQQPPM
jgi:hypothetical protein